MSGLLKADFYRLFRSKFFYILGGVVLLLSLAVFALFVLIVEFGGEIGGAMTAGALQRLSFDGTVGYCAAIAAAVFVCSDFSGGGIRDKVARGCGRGKVFFSLWIALSFAVLVYYLLTQFVVFALGGAAFGWEGVRAAEEFSELVTSREGAVIGREREISVNAALPAFRGLAARPVVQAGDIIGGVALLGEKAAMHSDLVGFAASALALGDEA